MYPRRHGIMRAYSRFAGCGGEEAVGVEGAAGLEALRHAALFLRQPTTFTPFRRNAGGREGGGGAGGGGGGGVEVKSEGGGDGGGGRGCV